MLEKGQVLAYGTPVPVGTVLVRRGNDPETGASPGILYADAQGDLIPMSLEEAFDADLEEKEEEAWQKGREAEQISKLEESRFSGLGYLCLGERMVNGRLRFMLSQSRLYRRLWTRLVY